MGRILGIIQQQEHSSGLQKKWNAALAALRRGTGSKLTGHEHVHDGKWRVYVTGTWMKVVNDACYCGDVAPGQEALLENEVVSGGELAPENMKQGIQTAFAVINFNGPRVSLITDGMASRNIYYCTITGGFAFSSDPGALTLLAENLEVDPHVLNEYLLYRWSLGRRHILAPILKVLPGSIIDWNPGRAAVEEKTTWRWRPAPSTENGDIPAWSGQVNQALLEAMQADTGISESAGVLLSGGIDSTLLAAIAKKCFRQVTAYTAEIEGYANPELERARKVANTLELRHVIIPVTDNDVKRLFPWVASRLGQPLKHYNNIILARLFEEISREQKLILHGDAADALFGTNEVDIAINVHNKLKYAGLIPGILLKSLCRAGLRSARPDTRRLAIAMMGGKKGIFNGIEALPYTASPFPGLAG